MDGGLNPALRLRLVFVLVAMVLVACAPGRYGGGDPTRNRVQKTESERLAAFVARYGDPVLEIENRCKHGPVDRANFSPRTAKVHEIFGWRRLKRLQTIDAMGFFVSSLSTTRSIPESYWGLGISAHELYPEARIAELCMERAQRELANAGTLSERFHSDYCRILEELGQTDHAIVQGLAALDLNEEYVEAHKCLGRAYLRSGDKKSAARHAMRVKELLERS